MESLLGGTWAEFLFLTCVVFGAGAFMMGRALAETWRPVGQCIAYAMLLGVGNRLFSNFFFAQNVLSIPGYIIGTAVLAAIALVAYRITKVRKMVLQYPWLYQRASLFSWREIS